MKEAIKVQSDTITVINGMSGAWVRQKQARSLLRSWLTVKKNGKGDCMCPGGHGEHSTGFIGGVYEEVVPKEGLPARHPPLPIHARCQPRCHPFEQEGLTDQLMSYFQPGPRSKTWPRNRLYQVVALSPVWACTPKTSVPPTLMLSTGQSLCHASGVES